MVAALRVPYIRVQLRLWLRTLPHAAAARVLGTNAAGMTPDMLHGLKRCVWAETQLDRIASPTKMIVGSSAFNNLQLARLSMGAVQRGHHRYSGVTRCMLPPMACMLNIMYSKVAVQPDSDVLESSCRRAQQISTQRCISMTGCKLPR